MKRKDEVDQVPHADLSVSVSLSFFGPSFFFYCGTFIAGAEASTRTLKLQVKDLRCPGGVGFEVSGCEQ